MCQKQENIYIILKARDSENRQFFDFLKRFRISKIRKLVTNSCHGNLTIHKSDLKVKSIRSMYVP